jgi:hypothetical protein
MLSKPIGQITESDLQSLVVEGRREDGQLEFKLTLPGGSDDEKREFLKDVSSMANSQGGDIIYGIREDRLNPEEAGKAAELVGITGVGEDSTKLWMFDLLNSSLEERVLGVEIRAVPLSAGGFALFVRIPRSWNAPHVVRHRNHWRFYGRNSAGVYTMNVSELRNAFLLSDTLAQRLETFRKNRLDAIVEDHPKLRLETDWSDNKPSTDEERESLLVIHLQPFDSLKPGYAIDFIQAFPIESDLLRLSGDPAGEPSRRINFDGLLVTSSNNFLQIYRSGTTEEVDTGELTSDCNGNRFDVECIGATELDRAVIKGVGRRLAFLKLSGVRSPILVSVSLLNVMGCKLLLRRRFYVGNNPGGMDFYLSRHTIDRPNLFLTGLVIDNLNELPLEQVGDLPTGWRPVQRLLRPYCDSIWNAVGYPKSQYFDPESNWVGEIYREPPG